MNRRVFLGSAASAAVPLATAQSVTLMTPLCDLLGIRHPVLQAGMSQVATPELVAAVSNAGGLGILAGAALPPPELRARIRRVRELTGKPFGVNLLLHDALKSPVDPAGIQETTLRAVQSVYNRIRARLGLPDKWDRPQRFPFLPGESIPVLIDEKVPVWSIGLGNPSRDQVRRFHEYGAKVIAMVCTVEDARAIEASGVDVIVAQGSEAGGHRST